MPDYLASYQAAGFDALCIGHEAIVDLESFTLAGGSNKSVRAACNKLTRLGYCSDLLQPPHSSEHLAQLRSVSDEWLTSMHGSEKRFSLGWFDAAYLQECPVMVVRNPNGDIVAFANIVSEYQLNEVTLDLMRHRKGMEAGTMDFLFVALFEWARAQRYATFNLGLSALAGVGEKPGDPALERLLHFIYEHINQFYNFKGLHEFKEKFHPRWSPRYLVYPRIVDLAMVWLAVTEANSGIEDFTWQYFRRRPIQRSESTALSP